MSAVSPLNLQRFTSELHQHPDRQTVNYVLTGIANVFHLGFDQRLPLVSDKKNKLSAYQQPDVIDAYLQNEGRVVGPYNTLATNAPLPALEIAPHPGSLISQGP